MELHRETLVQDRSDGREQFSALLEYMANKMAWRRFGACVRPSPREPFRTDRFFETKIPINAIEAKKLCASCPVVEQCLDWALENNERFGIWGGLTERERRRMRRRMGRTA